MSLRIINATEVRELLPMNRCVDVMAEAMQAASAGTVAVPPRIIMPLVDESGFLGVMPGSASAPKVYGTKVFSLHPGNPTEGRPAVQGFVALFDHDTGTPTAIVDGAEITAIRTAAASALATRYLARPDAQSHGVFGTGVQAVTHIEAIATVADLDQVVVWGRSADKAEALAAEQGKKTGLRIRACRDPQEAAACDIVSVVTGAVEPVVRAAWVRSGAHVNLVGAHTPSTREADSDLIAAGSVFVDL
ncbi:MAG: ornithine cyclodeaminase family protein, partial [Woeseiaceae bacterium]